jgi:archaellum component FlaC
MSGDPTLKSIDVKLDMFMESQQRVNESFALAHKDITAALSKSDTQQAEINHISASVSKLSSKHENLEEKLSTMHEQVAINKLLVGQTQDLKKIFAKSMVGVFVMFLLSIGSSVYTTSVKNQANAEVAATIAEMIKRKD